jgi:hypothetical protein
MKVAGERRDAVSQLLINALIGNNRITSGKPTYQELTESSCVLGDSSRTRIWSLVQLASPRMFRIFSRKARCRVLAAASQR